MSCNRDGNRNLTQGSNSCDKVCIEVKRVFDAGLMQEQITGATVTLSTSAPTPLVYVSAASYSSRGTVSSVAIGATRSQDTHNARVTATVGIPMRVVFVDASGAEGYADGLLSVPLDVVMCLPEQSVIPYEFEAVVSAIASEGTITGSVATLNCCVTVIFKIVVETELIVSSYGYCRIPPLTRYESDACAGFFELPLYPGR